MVDGQAPPLDLDDDGDLFAVPKGAPPATRLDDHPTSNRAAARVAGEQATIKARVHKFAKAAGPDGFIDDDLKAAFADSPESSHRKRRTELTGDGLIVDSGRTRQNGHGNAEVVWVHREFHDGPVKPGRMAQADWDQLVAGLAGQADEVSRWATQMLAEGRSRFGHSLADLARDLKRLRP